MARTPLEENMFSVAIAYLVFVCGFSLVASDPCLAPICVVDKPCVVELPPCVRLSETTRGWNWVKIEGNQVRGVPRKENRFNLKHLLTTESCQITITVLSEAETEQLGVCDYKRSNDSLRDFHEVGITYPVPSAEALHRMLNEGRPSSPIEVAPAETFVATSSSALSEKPQPTTLIPIIDVGIIIDEGPEVAQEAVRRPIVEEIRVGDLFQIELGDSSDTLEVQKTSPNTRAAIDGHFAVGFTIPNENQENHEFNVSSSSGELFSFKLQPRAPPAVRSPEQSTNHRFVTESQTSLLDLKGAVRQIRLLAEDEAVEVLSANDTHILWLSQKYLNRPLCTDGHNHSKKIMINEGNVITRLETICSEGEYVEMETGKRNRDGPIIQRILKRFLVPVLPVVLSVLLLVFCLKDKMILPQPCCVPKMRGILDKR